MLNPFLVNYHFLLAETYSFIQTRSVIPNQRVGSNTIWLAFSKAKLPGSGAYPAWLKFYM